MKIRHLKRKLKTFTLNSGQSLYLYPMADAELSEQDYFLSKKFQRYVKEEKSVKILEMDKPETETVKKKYSGYQAPSSQKPKKSKKFKSKKSSYVEEQLEDKNGKEL